MPSGLDIELFPCSGGMAEGFRRAGVVFAWAFDADPDACDSYFHNLGHRPVRMDVRDLLRLVRGGWRPGPIRFFMADPPCTPWSRAGKRLGVEDKRDMLLVTCELIRLLRPSCYLIGNVPGLEDSTQWHHVQAALAPLWREGYCIADFRTFDAADFGVPQNRIRPFWFGHLAGPCIRWPLPSHGPPGAGLPGLSLPPWVTCRDALQHLPLEELGRPVRLRRAAQPDGGHPACEMDAPARTLRADGGRAGRREGVLLANYRHPPAAPAAPAATIGAKYRGQGLVLDVGERALDPTPLGRVGKGESIVKGWPWDRPATVVDTSPALAPYGRNGRAGEHQRSHPNAVVLSERAATILQGFPEGWRFCGRTKRSRWSQLGQAMPPPLAEAVARAVVEQMARTDAGEARVYAPEVHHG